MAASILGRITQHRFCTIRIAFQPSMKSINQYRMKKKGSPIEFAKGKNVLKMVKMVEFHSQRPAMTLRSIFAISQLNSEKAKTLQRWQKRSDSSSQGQPRP